MGGGRLEGAEGCPPHAPQFLGSSLFPYRSAHSQASRSLLPEVPPSTALCKLTKVSSALFPFFPPSKASDLGFQKYPSLPAGRQAEKGLGSLSEGKQGWRVSGLSCCAGGFLLLPESQ